VANRGWLIKPRRERLGALNGVFETVEDALASAPKDRPIGWDSQSTAEIYANGFRSLAKGEPAKIPDFEYPALFWFSQILSEASEPLDVLEFGGSLGARFLQYLRLFDPEKICRWTVLELPEMVEQGRRLVTEFSISKLKFDTTLSDKNYAIAIACGSLQYSGLELFFASLEDTFPAHLIINRTPVSERAFVSLQNGYSSYFAMRIFAEKFLEAEFNRRGYEVADSWVDAHDAGVSLPEIEVTHKGYLFRRRLRTA
jgi:putative methyltransferase (TIGR04325 family)